MQAGLERRRFMVALRSDHANVQVGLFAEHFSKPFAPHNAFQLNDFFHGGRPDEACGVANDH